MHQEIAYEPRGHSTFTIELNLSHGISFFLALSF